MSRINKPVFDVFDMKGQNAINKLQYELQTATGEKKKLIQKQLEELQLEQMINGMGSQMRIKEGGSRKRMNGTKRRAARKGKRKSNRNKK